MALQTKTCSGCRLEKVLGDFSACSATNDGRQSRCRACQKVTKDEWIKKTKAKNSVAISIPVVKLCSRCDLVKVGDEFYTNVSAKDGLDGACISCIALKHLDLKRRFVAGYGSRCSCCGESRIEFLTMEHRNKDGAEHRAKREVQGAWRDAIAAGFPDIYTVLCYNCNQAETHGRMCPHKLETLPPVTTGGFEFSLW